MIAKIKQAVWELLIAYGEHRSAVVKRNNYRWYY